MVPAEHFDLDQDDLNNEFRDLIHTSYRHKSLPELTQEITNKVLLEEAFPHFSKLLAITMALPVSTADCESGFSELKKTETDLRNRMKAITLLENLILNLHDKDWCRGKLTILILQRLQGLGFQEDEENFSKVHRRDEKRMNIKVVDMFDNFVISSV